MTLETLKAFMEMHRAEWRADFTEAVKQAQKMLDVRAQASRLSRFYFDPNPAKDGDDVGYYYWGAAARKKYYQKLADMTTGKTGDMIAVLPERAKFSTDRGMMVDTRAGTCLSSMIRTGKRFQQLFHSMDRVIVTLRVILIWAPYGTGWR